MGHPFPAVCIRTSTERPEALDKGIFVLAGIDGKSLLQAVDTAVEMNRNEDDGLPVPNYTDENVSAKVVKLIQSYTGVVNKMVLHPLIFASQMFITPIVKGGEGDSMTSIFLWNKPIRKEIICQ